MSNTNRYVTKYHSAGQLVTAQKLREMQEFVQKSMLDRMSDEYRNPSDPILGTGGSKVDRVIDGFDANPSGTTMDVVFGRGSAMSVQSNTYVPAVVEVSSTLTLAAAGASDRYDRVYITAAGATANTSSFSVRLADGTLTTQTLPDNYRYDAEVMVATGTPGAGAPPALPVNSVNLYCVKVPVGATNSNACTFYDIRPFRSARDGGVDCLYLEHQYLDSDATNFDPTKTVRTSTSKAIHCVTGETISAIGAYSFYCYTPVDMYVGGQVNMSGYDGSGEIFNIAGLLTKAAFGGGSQDRWHIQAQVYKWNVTGPVWDTTQPSDGQKFHVRVDLFKAAT